MPPAKKTPASQQSKPQTPSQRSQAASQKLNARKPNSKNEDIIISSRPSTESDDDEDPIVPLLNTNKRKRPSQDNEADGNNGLFSPPNGAKRRLFAEEVSLFPPSSLKLR